MSACGSVSGPDQLCSSARSLKWHGAAYLAFNRQPFGWTAAHVSSAVAALGPIAFAELLKQDVMRILVSYALSLSLSTSRQHHVGCNCSELWHSLDCGACNCTCLEYSRLNTFTERGRYYASYASCVTPVVHILHMLRRRQHGEHGLSVQCAKPRSVLLHHILGVLCLLWGLKRQHPMAINQLTSNVHQHCSMAAALQDNSTHSLHELMTSDSFPTGRCILP